MAHEPNYITKVGLEMLLKELEWLQKDERPKITREVAYAASLGDRSDNAEYRFGKARLRSIDSRMRWLMAKLGNIIEVDPGTLHGDRVLFGATVVIEDEDGDEQTWKIYGEDEVDIPRGILSWKSPIARAMIGKQEGDAVTFKAPSGPREIEIVEIRYEAQDPIPDDWKPRPPVTRG